MRILYPYLRQHLKLIIFALVFATISQIFTFFDPLFFKRIIDIYATQFKEYSLKEFFSGILFFLFAGISAKLVAKFAKSYQVHFISVMAQKVGAQLYSDGLAHCLELPYSIFEDQQSGRTLSRLNKVRTDVEKLICATINILFSTLVAFILISAYACTVHWLIGPTYMLAVPLIGYLSFYLSKKLKPVQQSITKETTDLAGSTTESLRNIELVKSLGLADQEIRRLNSATGRILKLELKKGKYVQGLSFLHGVISNFVRACILLLMFYLIYTQEITFGQFFALYVYSHTMFHPLQELGNIVALYRETEVSLGHYQDILSTPIESKPLHPTSIGRLRLLEFEDVSFKYNSASVPSTRNISFKSNLGETIAFVGPSGAGKTTLVKLLVGLYRPLSGRILYNNEPSDKIDFHILREQIGYVTQDPQLFAGTIRENLLFVNPNATDQECLDVMYKAACNSLLNRADKGLDNIIGEGGIKLSGGEKQRLSIARALLRHPALLVFDEATSSLDSLTEKEVSQTVQTISKLQKHITILIAHRLSTIMHADNIFVLEKGKIIESGKHDKLLEDKGLYYAMWRQQVGEGDLT